MVTFATQEVLLFRSAKTGEVVVGAESKVEQCTYAAVLTRVEEELSDDLTGGWKVVEVCRLSLCNRLFTCKVCTHSIPFSIDGTEISSRVSVDGGNRSSTSQKHLRVI